MKRTQQQGFTIVELIIVVSVIAILAGIVILSYGAWRTKIATDTVKSDLSQVAAAMEDARTFDDDGYPAVLPTTIQPSSNVQLSGGGRPGGRTFCVQATSLSDASIQYYVSNKQKTPTSGVCTISTSVVAGTGASGYLNGPGSTATFTRIEGIGIAADGTIYAGDASHARRISTNGTVSVYDGTGADGFTTGVTGTEQFLGARGVAVDDAGNIYILAINNNAIRKITPSGVISTHTSSLHGTDLILGQDGNFYALEGDNFSGELFLVTMSGVATSLAGNSTNATVDGQGSAASLWDPRALARASDGTIYICENGSGLVRKVSPTYYVSTFAGSASGYPGGATSPIQGSCGGVAVDKDDILYVASGTKIQTIDKNGVVADFANTAGSVSSLLVDPNGDLYVATARILYKVTVP